MNTIPAGKSTHEWEGEGSKDRCQKLGRPEGEKPMHIDDQKKTPSREERGAREMWHYRGASTMRKRKHCGGSGNRHDFKNTPTSRGRSRPKQKRKVEDDGSMTGSLPQNGGHEYASHLGIGPRVQKSF